MKILISFSLLILSVLVYPQRIEFEFDYSQFGYDSSSNYIEFYYSFKQNSLTLVETDSVKYIDGILNITITDSASNEVIVDKDWSIHNEIIDESHLNSELMGVLGFVLEEGTYKCELTGSDTQKPGSKKLISEYLIVHPFLKLQSSISDIQLSSRILQESQNESSIFYKNTFEVTPVPTAIFGENTPVLFYYTELYNLAEGDKGGDFRLDQMVFNSRGDLVNQSHRMIGKDIDSRVEVGKIMVYKLPTDTYTLMLNLIDSVANYGVASSKKFFVYNPSVAVTDTFYQKTTSSLGTAFGVMSEEELDDLFAKSKYLATSNEINQYQKLTNEEGKRQFLNNFWEARDDNTPDARNSFYLLYLKRIDESNKKFTAMGRPGWKTDRGRVYLLYGEPNEIERYPNQIETRPYEIWNYHDIEGGVQFIFADITGFSDYQLVHSTKRGELRDDNWSRRIIVR
jgi:GWxTD domain-containing protein